MSRQRWKPIATAPRSTSRLTPAGVVVSPRYFLAFCPDMVSGTADPQAGICVCWWEPHIDGSGRWQGEGDFALNPTLWQRLPDAPGAAP